MPGIVAIISRRPAPENAAVVKAMVASMLHEESYVSGAFVHAPLNVAAGWVWHRGAYADCLPIWNEERDLCLIFAGEHFADPSEIQSLRSAGHKGVGENAGALVHLYEQEGPRFFEKLNGAFCGVLIDLRQGRVLVFNDRFGLGRLYYHETPEAFYFASEAKALLKALPPLRQLDPRGLGEWFACGCALQNRTLFAGVSLLPPASCWEFQNGQPPRRRVYFNKETWENQKPIPPADYYGRLKETFCRILPRYFAGQPLGLSLTGGLDSRMIIAAAPADPGSLPCYTFGGMYRDNEDVKVARLVAGLCHQDHRVITVGEGFFPEFPKLAARSVFLSDGAMDVTGSVELYANHQAREIAPVRMTGNYGSEILRGNVAFKPDSHLSRQIFAPEFFPHFQSASRTYQEERQTSRLSFIAFKQVPWHHHSRLSVEQTQVVVRSPFLDNDLVSLAYHAPADLAANKDLSYRLIEECNPALQGVPTDRGAFVRPGFVPEKVWHRYKEFFPLAEYAFDYGMPPWLAKINGVVSSLHPERLFLGHQKFYHFRIWYQNQLAGHVKEMLLDPRALARPYLNGSRVEQMVREHTAGRANFTREIHKLLSCELLQRQLIDQN